MCEEISGKEGLKGRGERMEEDCELMGGEGRGWEGARERGEGRKMLWEGGEGGREERRGKRAEGEKREVKA